MSDPRAKRETVSTGVATLDEMLNGGYPTARTMLLVGTPGTGKSTLAMQFLQAGLDAGETCLFVSTEQSHDEFLDAFEDFYFDLEHDRFTFTSVTARMGRTFEANEPELTIETMEGEKSLGQGFSAPFESDRITQYLERYHESDRVVIDSLSGLRPMAASPEVFRRQIFDLMQLFNEDFEATAVFTSEYLGSSPPASDVETVVPENAIQFNVYGVVRLWRERKRGAYRRFLDVMKMRGVDHDTRPFEMTVSTDGVNVIPRHRTDPGAVTDRTLLSTSVASLDELLGGGLQTGAGMLLTHDGFSDLRELLFVLISAARAEGYAVVFTPHVNLPPTAVNRHFERRGTSLPDQLDSDRFIVLDHIGAWPDHPNVHQLHPDDDGLQGVLARLHRMHDAEGTLFNLNTEALLETVGPEDTRTLRYWLESVQLDPQDVIIDVHNPEQLEDDIATYYVDAASQVLDLWRDETGLQYIHLQKSDTGQVGSVRLVDFIRSPPFLKLE